MSYRNFHITATGRSGLLTTRSVPQRRADMPELLEKIESDLLSLPSQQRAFLADRLLSSLDGEEHLTDIDVAWLAEVENRYEQYKKGLQKGIPGKVVFSEAKEITSR